ncbi:MAG: histidine--tRNA ligase [Methanobacteriota archaeon]|nr:MAG: histidine--tRNA ligase [Euryarchaeota archaeon]
MVERPRGTRDLTPEDMAKRRYVLDSIRRISDSFGFREIATPTFENAELFILRSGPDIVDQMYVFKDKKDRELALRPELTASVVRFFLAELKNYPKPLKLYYLGNCFRYERPQKGRYREFYQYGAELIGGKPLDSDAELIDLAMSVIRGVGLKNAVLRVGNIGILRKLLEESSDILACLRSISTENFDELSSLLAKNGLSDIEDTILSLAKLKGPDVLDEARNLVGDKAIEEVDYLETLGGVLKNLGMENIQYEPGMVRGLDYYTGMVFEIDCPNLGAEKQVMGGGSYSLADLLGGEPIFSTGFAFGVDRMVLALEAEDYSFPSRGLDVYVIPIGDSMREKAMGVLKTLRENGFSADMDLVGRGPSKNLDYANAVGAKKAIFAGEDEWSRNSVSVKDMESGEQTDVPIDQLIDALSK